MSGREPTFLLGRWECIADRLGSGSLCLQLEKIREAAERVARSEGLEVVDVEWKIGKQRFLRVYIDRVPDMAGYCTYAETNGEATSWDPISSDAAWERVSNMLSCIVD